MANKEEKLKVPVVGVGAIQQPTEAEQEKISK